MQFNQIHISNSSRHRNYEMCLKRITESEGEEQSDRSNHRNKLLHRSSREWALALTLFINSPPRTRGIRSRSSRRRAPKPQASLSPQRQSRRQKRFWPKRDLITEKTKPCLSRFSIPKKTKRNSAREREREFVTLGSEHRDMAEVEALDLSESHREDEERSGYDFVQDFFSIVSSQRLFFLFSSSDDEEEEECWVESARSEWVQLRGSTNSSASRLPRILNWAGSNPQLGLYLGPNKDSDV